MKIPPYIQRVRPKHLIGKARATARIASDNVLHMRERARLQSGLSAWESTLADRSLSAPQANQKSTELRACVQKAAGLGNGDEAVVTLDDLWREIAFLKRNTETLKPYFERLRAPRVLFSGQCYYYHWYLSRSLRDLGWQADQLNWDTNPSSQIFYHGEDMRFDAGTPYDLTRDLKYYVEALYRFDVFHFGNAHGISFGGALESFFEKRLGHRSEIFLLKSLGKKICYTNNGCLDGTLQSSFAQWRPDSPCEICSWKNNPAVCSDRTNYAWGKFRNSVTDFQCLFGGNRVDFNRAAWIHETPEIYCLDKDIWSPDLSVPAHLKVENNSPDTIQLYHAIGNRDSRTAADGRNIKSSHVYLPLIDKLRSEGMRINLISPTNVPNKDVRFLQSQADIFLEMLTFGWFGANAREAMMLGKPVICFLRPEWLESLAAELPDYVKELPIISATPETVEPILRELIADPLRRAEIGKDSRAFALKWHSREAAAQKFDTIYRRLLKEETIVVPHYA